MSTDVRANTMLPARREPVTLTTADGLRLVGELALPEGTPRATLVCLHPLPTHGGMMDSHLYRKAAFRLPALADIAVLRFNTRGTASEAGRSEGAFDNGDGEQLDVQAALEFVTSRNLPNVWLVGWSFGTDLALRHGCADEVQGAVLISPPLRYSSPEDLAAWTKPLVCLVPEFDDYLRPAQARERFTQARIEEFAGAKHLFVGYTEQVLDAIVATVAPEAEVPLPRVWDGPAQERRVTIV